MGIKYYYLSSSVHSIIITSKFYYKTLVTRNCVRRAGELDPFLKINIYIYAIQCDIVVCRYTSKLLTRRRLVSGQLPN